MSLNPRPSAQFAFYSRPGRVRVAAVLLLSLLLLLSAAPPAAAQGIIIDPPPFPPPFPPDRPIASVQAPPVVVESHRVDARIDGPIATVQVTQLFRNPANQVQEGRFLFALPDDAAISDLQLTVDGQVLEGKLLKKEEARRIYEEIVRRQRDPALLEYVGRDLFQTSVFPIPGHDSRTVQLTYRELVRQENGLRRFVAPLGSRRQGQPPAAIAVTVELSGQPGLRTLYSPSHQVAIERRGDDAATVGFESADPAQQRDFALYWGSEDSEVGVSLLSYKPAGEDGFFLLLAAPGVEVEAEQVVARDIVLVLDVSGSMEGEKLAQAQSAAQFVVEHLNEGDRLNLISFSTGVDRWKSTVQPMDNERRIAADLWIRGLRATGSTDINRALLESLALLDNAADGDRPAYILFLTDGLPTQGEEDPDRIVANALGSAPPGRSLRLFTFGVGYDVNTDLLDELSAGLGGRSTYVSPDEQIDEAVSGFYAGVSTPVLANLSVALTDAAGASLDVSDSYPYPLPDLFAGGQLVWVGRYVAGGAVSVRLTGTINDTERAYDFTDLELATSGGESAVARLWATRKIGALLTAVRRNGADPETVEAIIDLSLTYGIVTPYTSYLVEEPGMAMGDGSVTWTGGFRWPPDPTQMNWSHSPYGSDAAPRAQAYSVAPAAIAESATADAIGMRAVEASKARTALAEAEAAPESAQMRFVASKSFVSKGEVQAADGAIYTLWVDTALDDAMTPRPLVFGGEEYFALAQDRQVAQWLSLSPALVVVIDGEAVQVVPGEVDGTAASDPSSVAQPDTRSLWQRIWDRLLGR